MSCGLVSLIVGLFELRACQGSQQSKQRFISLASAYWVTEKNDLIARAFALTSCDGTRSLQSRTTVIVSPLPKDWIA